MCVCGWWMCIYNKQNIACVPKVKLQADQKQIGSPFVFFIIQLVQPASLTQLLAPDINNSMILVHSQSITPDEDHHAKTDTYKYC